MDDQKRLELIVEAIRYCQRVKALGMPANSWAKALREPVFFLWELKDQSKEASAKYRSKAAVGLSYGGGGIVRDHAIPFKYLRDALLALPEVTVETVRATLQRFPPTAVLITKEEDKLLSRSGYGHNMPQDWDTADVLARYKAVGIELE